VLLPPTGGVQRADVGVEDERRTVQGTARAPTACGPGGATPSATVHSRSQRHRADLPWGPQPVPRPLTVRTCVCRKAAGRRRMFTERWPDLAAPYARTAQRLVAARRAIGLALGGQAGARWAARLRGATSPSTRLRLVHTAPVPGPATLPAVGVDAWAWRRGHRDGTLRVHLSDHRVVDRWPDRAAAAVAAWLTAHAPLPGSRRERRALDAEGIRQGAPQAIQVVDRVHRVANRRAAVAAVLGTPRPALLAAAVRPAQALAAVAAAVPVPSMDARQPPLDSGPPAAPRGGAAAAAGPVGRTR